MRKILHLLTGLAALSLVWVVPASTQPVRGKVLGEVSHETGPDAVALHIGFNFPVQYLRHFPHSAAELAVIRVEPLAVAPVDQAGISAREAFVPPPDWDLPVLDVIYDGDLEGGPFLIVLFDGPTTFSVHQGKDHRSLTLSVPAGDAP